MQINFFISDFMGISFELKVSREKGKVSVLNALRGVVGEDTQQRRQWRRR
jgi:hypothetical protein